MHENRNFILVIALIAAVIWAFFAWFISASTLQGIIATVIAVALGCWLTYAFVWEDTLPNHLRRVMGDIYYEADGISFMPIVRISEKKTEGDPQAELCVYFQNRYENPACTVVHLRPPTDSFVIRPNMRDAHFAFKALGGDFGVIRQPISVPPHLQGEIVNVELAAASFYPRSQGSRLRKQKGINCGTLNVDWHGAAFKAGVHEVSGEIELLNPCVVHLSMPRKVANTLPRNQEWQMEQLEEGVPA